MKTHHCTKPYVVKTGKTPVRLHAGETVVEDVRGRLWRVDGRGNKTELDRSCFHAGSFVSAEWETASAAPGTKRAAKKPKKDD